MSRHDFWDRANMMLDAAHAHHHHFLLLRRRCCSPWSPPLSSSSSQHRHQPLLLLPNPSPLRVSPCCFTYFDCGFKMMWNLLSMMAVQLRKHWVSLDCHLLACPCLKLPNGYTWFSIDSCLLLQSIWWYLYHLLCQSLWHKSLCFSSSLFPSIIITARLHETPGKINQKIDLDSPKVVTQEKLGAGDKKVYCRCWLSGTFPLCDGSHAKHNEAWVDVCRIIFGAKYFAVMLNFHALFRVEPETMWAPWLWVLPRQNKYRESDDSKNTKLALWIVSCHVNMSKLYDLECMKSRYAEVPWILQSRPGIQFDWTLLRNAPTFTKLKSNVNEHNNTNVWIFNQNNITNLCSTVHHLRLETASQAWRGGNLLLDS